MSVLTALFTRWAEVDPQHGLKLAAAIHPNGSSATSAVFETWILQDPDAAIDALDSSRARLGRNWQHIAESSFRSLALDNPEEANRRVLDFDANHRTDELVGQVVAYWADRDPERALAYARSLENPAQRHTGLLYSLHTIGRRDPPSAAPAALELKPGDARDRLLATIRKNWSATDAAGAAAWFRDNVPEPTETARP